jgi:hypothetical protein
MRTNATVHGGKDDMNIEEIHCQIVMRIQRNKQILRELEGGPIEPNDANWSGTGMDPYSIENQEPISR